MLIESVVWIMNKMGVFMSLVVTFEVGVVVGWQVLGTKTVTQENCQRRPKHRKVAKPITYNLIKIVMKAQRKISRKQVKVNQRRMQQRFNPVVINDILKVLGRGTNSTKKRRTSGQM